MFGFENRGYSPDFVENMADVVHSFMGEQVCTVMVRAECDDICDRCPHREDDVCRRKSGRSRWVVQHRDEEVIERLGLEEGRQYSNHQLRNLVLQNISPDQIGGICQGCSWLEGGYCEQGLKRAKSDYEGPSFSQAPH
jgi:hypothetical protein